MKRTFEEMLVEYCAPTLAKVKTSNIFCCEMESKMLEYEVALWNAALLPFGIKIMILRYCTVKYHHLIYVYREKMLLGDLAAEGVMDELVSCGYGKGDDISSLLSRLSCKLESDGVFPHEIGLFLGYPLHDVKGFMENEGKNFCAVGYWKVYDKPEEAKRRFEIYTNCTKIYKDLHKNGKSVRELTVAA